MGMAGEGEGQAISVSPCLLLGPSHELKTTNSTDPSNETTEFSLTWQMSHYGQLLIKETNPHRYGQVRNRRLQRNATPTPKPGQGPHRLVHPASTTNNNQGTRHKHTSEATGHASPQTYTDARDTTSCSSTIERDVPALHPKDGERRQPEMQHRTASTFASIT